MNIGVIEKDVKALVLFPPACRQQSVAEMQQLQHKTLASPTQDAPGFLLKDSAGNSSSKNSSCDMDDFVMVPAQLPSKPFPPLRKMRRRQITHVRGGNLLRSRRQNE